MGIVQRPMSAVARAVLISFTVLVLASSTAMAQRSDSAVAKAIQDAMTYARTLPDSFGGAWLVDGGAAMAFTHRATDEQIADVLGRIEPWVAISVVRVDHSEAEITAAKEAISLAVRTDELPFITGVGTDIENNAVRVSIEPQWFEVCQAGVLARFAPMRMIFESSGGDIGLDSTPVPAGSPSASLPPGCLPPTSPSPSMGTPSPAPTIPS
jgi:hypothetical protein